MCMKNYGCFAMPKLSDLGKCCAIITSLILFFAAPIVIADSRIQEIKFEYQSIISALPSLRIEQAELSGYSTEGGSASAYRDTRGNIRFLKVELYGESGKVIEEYYLRNRQLIFVYSVRYQYNVPFYLTPERSSEIGSEAFDSKKTTVHEDRYYFDNHKLFRWINGEKKKISPDSKEFKKAEKYLLSSFNEFIAKFE